MKSTKLERLEKKLNITTELVQEMTEVIEEFEIAEPTPVVVAELVSSEKPVEVFTLEILKSDFMLIRNNIMKLVADGQRTLSSASVIDVSDLKASTIQALAGLQVAIGGNLKMLIDSYKIIVEIEKLRQKEKPMIQTMGAVNMGTVNNIAFSGSTSELLQLIHDNK
jgi:hypothetical protein